MTEALVAELARVAGALGPAVEPPDTLRLLSSTVETARRLFGATGCSLALLNDEGDELLYTTASGEASEAVTGMRLPVGRGVAGWVVQSGQPVAVSDVRSDPRFAQDVAAATGYFPEAILAAPVVSERGVLGVLTVLDRDTSRPEATQDMLLLQVFCDHAAIALESARSFSRVAAVLLDALAEAAGSGSDLAAALSSRSPAASDDGLSEVAALLGRLGRADPPARALAVTLITDVLAHVERGSGPRPGS